MGRLGGTINPVRTRLDQIELHSEPRGSCLPLCRNAACASHKSVLICSPMESDIFRALADPTRRSVFEKLAVGGMNGSDLRRGMAISQPAMSQHLAVLRSAGLVRERRDGRFVNYEVDPGARPDRPVAGPVSGLLAAPHRRPQGAAEGHGSMSDIASEPREEAEMRSSTTRRRRRKSGGPSPSPPFASGGCRRPTLPSPSPSPRFRAWRSATECARKAPRFRTAP